MINGTKALKLCISKIACKRLVSVNIVYDSRCLRVCIFCKVRRKILANAEMALKVRASACFSFLLICVCLSRVRHFEEIKHLPLPLFPLFFFQRHTCHTENYGLIRSQVWGWLLSASTLLRASKSKIAVKACCKGTIRFIKVRGHWLWVDN